MRWWHAAIFLFTLAIFAAATAPMRVVADRLPSAVAYQNVSGTIWRATFSGVRYGDFDAEVLDWRLSFLDLVQGRLVADLDISGASSRGHVRILANGRGDRRIVASNLTARKAGTDGQDAAARATGLDVLFQNGRCRSAMGRVEADIQIAPLPWRGPRLQGEARCDGATAKLPLEGGDAEIAVAALVTMSPDGSARWAVTAQPKSAPAQLAARAAGVEGAGGALRNEGKTRWLPF